MWQPAWVTRQQQKQQNEARHKALAWAVAVKFSYEIKISVFINNYELHK
jgi:hypothetical protein